MRLIVAANRLFHRQGLERSAIADIAREAAVPAGNVYYYFKTKEELVEAVIARRNAFIAAWLADLETEAAPRERLIRFVGEFERTSDMRARHGCPVGGLCHDANRLGGALASQARGAFELLIDWLRDQFAALGAEPGEARAGALHLLACLEGASLLAHSFADPSVMRNETARLKDWLEGYG